MQKTSPLTTIFGIIASVFGGVAAYVDPHTVVGQISLLGAVAAGSIFSYVSADNKTINQVAQSNSTSTTGK